MWVAWWLTGCVDAGSVETENPCEVGCRATLEAACANGPDTEASCVSTCEIIRAEACAESYDALLACSLDAAVTCDEAGLPTVLDCEPEETAFRECLLG